MYFIVLLSQKFLRFLASLSFAKLFGFETAFSDCARIRSRTPDSDFSLSVGVPGIEPGTSTSQTWRATSCATLRYVPRARLAVQFFLAWHYRDSTAARMLMSAEGETRTRTKYKLRGLLRPVCLPFHHLG